MNERDCLLSIGRFAYASGLTVKALHHYDEIGLLRPAHVDGSSGYRYYGPAQLGDAQAIRRLRQLELPLDEIRLLLGADAAEVRARLAEHRARVAASTEDKRKLLAQLDRFITTEEELMADTQLKIEIDDVPELRLAGVIRHMHADDVVDAVGRMLRFVGAWLDERQAVQVGSAVGVFRAGDREGWHVVEAGFPAEAHVEPDDVVGVYVYPASRAATYEHVGPHEDLDRVGQRFVGSVIQRGLVYTQPIRVEYCGDPATRPASEVRSRFVWPVE